ncbi:MAG: DUF1638 domain-containing protein [Verrucomicrobiota bacterium]
MSSRFFKVIACEIAFREICHVAARTRSLLDLEFVTQGLHDMPGKGAAEIQRRIDAVPSGRYEAILLGYGLCGNLIRGIEARHAPLVIPRAHDCITFFLGSKERYQQRIFEQPGAYYYTSGWLECWRRRGEEAAERANFLPTRAGLGLGMHRLFEEWVQKFGEEKARYLQQVMDDWTRHYTHGCLIYFPFTGPLALKRQVRKLCAKQNWEFEIVRGDIGLLQRWVDGHWNDREFLIVPCGERVLPSFDTSIIRSASAREGES